MYEREWTVRKNQRRQLQQVVQEAKYDDAQKPEVLIQLDFR